MSKEFLQRDHYLDFSRGIAVVSIILIHTVFQSGNSYVPDICRTFVLLLDVPFFVFLSGQSAFYNSNIRRMLITILRIWILWMFYITIIDCIYPFIDLEFDREGWWMIYLKHLLFQGSTSTIMPKLITLNGSLWFFHEVYLIVIPIGFILINLAKRNLWKKTDFIFPLIISFVGVLYTTLYAEEGINFFLLNQKIWFYLFFFLLGYIMLYTGFKINRLWKLLIRLYTVLIIWGGVSRVLGVNVWDLQSAKFPPNIMYLCASMGSIYVYSYFRNYVYKLKDIFIGKVFEYIGRNAICFYFSQGIGGSVLYYIIDLINMHWFPKMLICFGINLIISIFIGILLSYVYKYIRVFIDRKLAVNELRAGGNNENEKL